MLSLVLFGRKALQWKGGSYHGLVSIHYGHKILLFKRILNLPVIPLNRDQVSFIGRGCRGLLIVKEELSPVWQWSWVYIQTYWSPPHCDIGTKPLNTSSSSHVCALRGFIIMIRQLALLVTGFSIKSIPTALQRTRGTPLIWKLHVTSTTCLESHFGLATEEPFVWQCAACLHK